MKSYYSIGKFPNKDIYAKFIHKMLCQSDAFSLVYFKHNEKEQLTHTAEKIEKDLLPFLIDAHVGNEWASMCTLNMNNHVYKIALYKADLLTKEVLLRVDCIFDWNYPLYPMDLCFFRDGFGWLATCSHENDCFLFTNDEIFVNELKKIGVNLSYCGKIDDSSLFYNEKAKLNV